MIQVVQDRAAAARPDGQRDQELLADSGAEEPPIQGRHDLPLDALVAATTPRRPRRRQRLHCRAIIALCCGTNNSHPCRYSGCLQLCSRQHEQLLPLSRRQLVVLGLVAHVHHRLLSGAPAQQRRPRVLVRRHAGGPHGLGAGLLR
jgi:hypothetical protein